MEIKLEKKDFWLAEIDEAGIRKCERWIASARSQSEHSWWRGFVANMLEGMGLGINKINELVCKSY